MTLSSHPEAWKGRLSNLCYPAALDKQSRIYRSDLFVELA
jgi:hypothetical protein